MWCKKNVRRDVVLIAITNASLPSKKRILTVCVKLFLEQGYKKTTVAQIARRDLGFQQYFSKIFSVPRTAYWLNLVEFMFSTNQLRYGSRRGRRASAGLCLCRGDSHSDDTDGTEQICARSISRRTQKESIGLYFPRDSQGTLSDLRFLSAGVDRTGLLLYGARLCRNHAGLYAASVDEELTLEKKLQMLLTMSLRSYHVPEDEIQKIIAFIGGMDIRTVSERVMHELFKALAMRFEFTL